MIDIAIDLGGSNTSIYVKNSGLVLKEPSLLGVIKQGDGYELDCFGIDAKKKQGKTDENTIIFSPIADGVIKSTEYASVLLGQLLSKIFSENEFKKINAVITYPCGISIEERQAYEEICYNNGIKTVWSVPNIICSALGANIDISSGKSICMVDMGATATDIATINFDSIVKGATIGIGGKAMDIAIVNMIAENHNVVVSLPSAQKIKEEIATLLEGDNKRFEMVGFDAVTKVMRSIFVSAGEIYKAIIPYFEDIVKTVRCIIQNSPPDVVSDILKTGIVICGGMANIPELERYFKKQLDLPIMIADEKENACIIGAGALLSNVKRMEKIAK